MARLRKNLVLGELSGRMGNLVLRQVGGKSVVQAAPVRLMPPTAGELANQQLFKEAQEFARQARQNPALWAAYIAEAKKRGGTSNAYAVAISDYRKPPELHELTLQTNPQTGQQTLLIHATDNVAVARAEMRLLRADGSEIADGAAMQVGNTDYWQFVLTDGKEELDEVEDDASNGRVKDVSDLEKEIDTWQ